MSVVSNISGNLPTYRFYISYPTISIEVFPLNFLSTSLIDELEADQIFYRRKFSGSLLFGTNSTSIDDSGATVNRMDDWTLFWLIENVDPCHKIEFTITKTVEGVVSTYWEGYFSTTDGKFDIDRCTFEVTPKPEDEYTPILDLTDKQYNILEIDTVVSTNAYVSGVYDVDYTRNRWLAMTGAATDNVLEYLAERISPGVTVSSTFFTAANNPATLAANHLLYLMIAQKSDILRPTSTEPSTTAMMSWNELMEILWAMFQVKWNYDLATDTINVEHISWFETVAAGVDLRTQTMCEATNKYSYLKTKMPKYEKFAFMEADNVDFVGVPIYYDPACVDDDPETNKRELSIPVTTDLEYIIDNADSVSNAISDEGFVILCNYESGGNYFVESEWGVLSGIVRLNNHLSWSNLEWKYYRHNRSQITGFINNLPLTLWSAIKTKIQECSAILCDSYDPEDEITTELGETYFSGAKARVQSSELRPTGEIKFRLLYGPASNVNTGVADDKYVRIIQIGTDHFHATLTHVADVNIDILIHAEIFDAGCASVCTGANDAWQIPMGAREASFTFDGIDNLCTPMLANYKNLITISVTTAGWNYSFEPDPLYDYDKLC